MRGVYVETSSSQTRPSSLRYRNTIEGIGASAVFWRPRQLLLSADSLFLRNETFGNVKSSTVADLRLPWAHLQPAILAS